MERTARAAIGVAVLLMFSSARAHHTFAMFDAGKTLTLRGTVRELQWNNPHCFIQLLVADENGTTEWSIEMGSPMVLARIGWKPNSIKTGDKIAVVVHPMRDGSRGGSFVSATGQDGTVFGKQASQ
jgi:hypothetical protein